MVELGIAFALGNWLGVVSSLAWAFPVDTCRARVEEQALLASIGAPHARIIATSQRFVRRVL